MLGAEKSRTATLALAQMRYEPPAGRLSVATVESVVVTGTSSRGGV
jgi:hypothetical protein